MKIFVVGGTGVVGSTVVAELQRRGASMKLLVRKDSAKVPDGVEKAVGDLLDPPTVDRAMEGCDRLYLLNAVSADELTQALVAFDLARRRNFERVVYHSLVRPEADLGVPHFAVKFAVEAALAQSKIPWTVMRPNYFMQNDLQLREPITKQGVYPQALGQIGVSAVDVRDIAEASAIAVLDDGHIGKKYDLVGPEPITGPGAARIWSETLGREVRYGGDDLDKAEETMRSQMPAWSAFDLRLMLEVFHEHGFTAEPGDVETFTKLLGHAPRSYAEFAREAAAKWNDDPQK